MGFGKSETPPDRTYGATEHIANLESLLVDELDLHDITLVMHDWGGPIGTGFAPSIPIACGASSRSTRSSRSGYRLKSRR